MRQDIGGAIVRRPFQFGDRHLMPGARLTAEEVASIPYANRSALIDKKMMETFPKSESTPKGDVKRFLISAGFGRYHVVEGVQLTEAALPKKDAEKMVRKRE